MPNLILSPTDFCMLVEDIKKGRHTPVISWIKSRISYHRETLSKSSDGLRINGDKIIPNMGDNESAVDLLEHMAKGDGKPHEKIWYNTDKNCLEFWDGQNVIQVVEGISVIEDPNFSGY